VILILSKSQTDSSLHQHFGFTIFFLLACVGYNMYAGEIASVDGTPFDLRQPVELGSRLPQVQGAPGVEGFDHNFCLAASEGVPAARVVHQRTGRILEVFTDQPGIQLYTGNHLVGLAGKSGVVYQKHSCLALETQNYPDAIHHVRTNVALL
jgi:aldose 1-epimerase